MAHRGEGRGRRRGRGREVRRRAGVPRSRRHRAWRQHCASVRGGDDPGAARRRGLAQASRGARGARADRGGMRQGHEQGRRGRGGAMPRRGYQRSPPARALGGCQRNRPAVHRPRSQDPGEGARADLTRAAQGHGGFIAQGPVARGGGDGQLLRGMPPRAHAAVPRRAHEQTPADAARRPPHGPGVRLDRAGVRRG